AEGKVLIEGVQAALGGDLPEVKPPATLEFHAGVSYRNILVYRSEGPAPFSEQTKTQPPHDIPDKKIDDYLPQGPGSTVRRSLMERSREVLSRHPVNKMRQARAQRPATQIWLWGQGR